MMKLDLHYLRVPLALLTISALVSVFVYLLSSWHEQEVLDRFYQEERGYNTAKRKFEEANRNRTLYERYLANYLRLVEEGFIGEEPRLDWIEMLQSVDKEYNLPSLNYQINAKEDADLLGVNTKKNIKVYKSNMQLKVDILHEEDFFSLLESMQESAKGFFSLGQCDIGSNIGRNGPLFSPRRGNLAATCELNWITIVVERQR